VVLSLALSEQRAYAGMAISAGNAGPIG